MNDVQVMSAMQSHQRQWNNLQVDNNLRDEWLNAVNSLRHFSVYSTCEGHSGPTGAGGSDHARIWLSLKGESYPPLASVWKNDISGVRALLAKHFTHPETRFDLFHQQGRLTDHIRNFTPPEVPENGVSHAILVSLVSKLPACDGIGLHLDHSALREEDAMPPSVTAWFQDTVRSLTQFENEISKTYIA